MKFLVTRNFSSRSMTHYAHNTPNGFSPTVILQAATPRSGGLLSFCGFARGHVAPQAPQPERDGNDKFT